MDTFATMLRNFSIPIYINLIISVFVIATIIDRTATLFFIYRIDADAFVNILVKLVKSKNFERAIQYCNSIKSPVARVCKAGLMKVEKGSLEISTAIDEELMRATPLLEKRIASLWSFANIATLIGLLGTIYGLIRAFSALAAVSPEQKAAFLARGISEAMNNTAIGLGIAIICMIGHLILSGRSKRMISDLDVSAVAFENFLLLHKKTQEK
jgi:biopolymer transport protein ExbB